MTMAAAIESRNDGASARSKSSRIAAVDLLADLDQAETVWRSLENQQHFSTPYQRFDFLRPWQRQVGAREGLRPLVVIAYDRDRVPLLLLPLVLSRAGAFAPRISWAASTRHSTWRCGIGNLPPSHRAPTSRFRLPRSAIAPRSTSWRSTSNLSHGRSCRTRWRCCRASPPPTIVP